MKKFSKNLIRIISFFVMLCVLSTVASAVQTDTADIMTEAEYEEIFNSLDIPSFINEDGAKAAKHVERLAEYEDSYDKIGYKNADGTNTLYMFSSPVKYMDENGELKDADPNITETTDTLKQSGYSYKNEFGKLKTYFADSLSNDKGVKIELNNDSFEFGFSINEKKQNIFQKAVSVFEKPQNEAAVISENRVQKLKHLKVDNQNNVVSLPTIDGATQTLILKEKPEDNKVTFWVKSDDTTPTVDNSNNNVVFSTEQTSFSISISDVKDSGGLISTNNTAKFLSTQNDSTLVEVTLDENVTQNPETVYPLSVTLNATTTSREIGSFAPLDVDYSYFEDTTYYSNDTTEYQDAEFLIIGEGGKYETDENGNTEYIAKWGTVFMKYDTSMLEGIDPRFIYDAQLILTEASGKPQAATIELLRVTTDWYEDVVDLSVYNEYDGTYPGNNNVSIPETKEAYLLEIDITQLFTDHMLYEQGFGGGVPNYGFQLRSSNAYLGKHIISSENPDISSRPFISIRYEDPESLTLGYTTHDYLNPDDPSDWYYFTPSATSFYDIYTSGNTDVYAYLYDSDLALITQDDDSGEYANFKITREFQANETYYLKVQSRSYSTAGYYYLDIINCVYNEFSTARTSPRENQTMITAMTQSAIDYNNWPASQDSRYYGLDDTFRMERLLEIRESALLTSLGGILFDDAGSALSHFLDNTGTDHIISNEELFNESESAKEKLKGYIDSFLEACENTVPSNSSRNVYSNEYLSLSFPDNDNWQRALGNCTITIAAWVERTGSSYYADVTITVEDFYDWEKTETNMGNLPVSSADMWELHHGGLAKKFKTIGTSNIQISWTTGQRCDTGILVVPY